jgi:hypothetical protein|nr:MAG TPA: hypothetical protein [Caudoviricetes sp.]
MIDCSRTENYFAEKQRMTKKHKLNHGGYSCKLNCADCPLSHLNNDSTMLCSDFETCYPEKAIAIVQKWSDEHPPKTYLSEFLTNYPNALLDDSGMPKLFCPYRLGLGADDCRKDGNCVKCWNQLIEDGEE